MSQPATVDLCALVAGRSLVSYEEIALTGGVSLESRRQRLQWLASPRGSGHGGAALPEGAGGALDEAPVDGFASRGLEEGDAGSRGRGELRPRANDVSARQPNPAEEARHADRPVGGCEVSISPMEIKTFRLTLASRGVGP